MNPRILSLALAIGVGAVCVLPAYAALAPMDADYSETMEVTYRIDGDTVSITVPVDDGVHVPRCGPHSFIPRFVRADDPAVMEVADVIMQKESDDVSRASVARDFVDREIAYVSDREAHDAHEYWQLPSETLRLGTGDCEDKAILYISILKAMGLDSIFVFEPNHVSVAVDVDTDGTVVERDGRQYIAADPTSMLSLGKSVPEVIGTASDSPEWTMWAIVGLFLLLEAVLVILLRSLGVS